MIFRKNKETINDKKKEDDISGATYQTEHALDSRLDGLRFRVLNKSEFEAQKVTEPHSIDQISFVRVFENGAFSHFELYKGDILILPNATPPTPINKFGKVVRINDDMDDHNRYIYNRNVISLPSGESISGTAVGFSGDVGSGPFLYTDADGKILLGFCSNNEMHHAQYGAVSSTKLKIIITHGNNKQTLTYELLPMFMRAGPNAGSTMEKSMILINGTYIYTGVDFWPSNTETYGEQGSIIGSPTKDSGEYYGGTLYRIRSSIGLYMPNIHDYNVPSGASQFAARLFVVNSDTGTQILNEGPGPFSRLGLYYSLDDGTYLGSPEYVECFVPGAYNYEDFLEIAKVICTPTTDSQGNEVII